jgi:competence protein ComEC
MAGLSHAFFSVSAPRIGPFPVLAGWVLGTALQLQQPLLWGFLVYVSTGLAAVGLACWGRCSRLRHRVPVLMVLLGVAGLAFALTGLRGLLFAQSSLDPQWEGRDVQVQGVVSQLPQQQASGWRFRLQVESAQLDGQAIQIPQRLDVGWYAGTRPDLPMMPTVRAGERWRMTLRLKAPHGNHNPHGFDYELWLWEQGVQASAYVRDGARAVAPLRLAQTWHAPVAQARQWVRERIRARVVVPEQAALVAALVVGEQSAIAKADWEVFRTTGVAHLVAISGLHVTMFAWLAAAVVGRLWRCSARLCQCVPAPNAALIGGLLLATAYALFSGWGLPAQRTCVMLATVSCLRLCGVHWPWPQRWLLACAVVLAWDPWAWLQAGFWLSFVAVAVLFSTDAGQRYGAGWRGAAQRALAMLREQWIVTLALAPLTLLLFGQVSLVGLLANLAAIPWITWLVTPLAMLGVLWAPLWDFAAAAIVVWMEGLRWLATLPWATLARPAPPLWLAAAGLLGVALLVLRLPWHLRGLGAALLLPLFLWQVPQPAEGHFELLAADVGQGNAVLVRTARHALLYDTGPTYGPSTDAGQRVLVPLLQALQVSLDRVLLSHRDADHAGGAAAVLAMQPQAHWSSSIEDSHPLQAQRPIQRCEVGQSWVWDGVAFEILHPSVGDYARKLTPNALSCVLRIRAAGGQTALLVGDIEKAQEAALVASGVDLRADWLLVPHHGSKTSSSGEFLDAVQPHLAMVQSGYKNRYGHPVSQVLQRYYERNILVQYSPRCGAMIWQSGQPLGYLCTRLERGRYWQHRVP